MKNYLKYLIILILPFFFVACGGDDDPVEEGILGKWTLVSCEDEDWEREKPIIFYFRENNRLTITFAEGKRDEEFVPCRYTISGSHLYIDFAYGDEVYEGTYEIKNDVMTFDMIAYDPDSPQDVYEDFLTFRRIK